MERNKKILIGAFVLILLALLLWWFLRPKQTSTQATPEINRTLTPVPLPTVEADQPVAVPEAAPVIESRNARRFAMQFAERYGSYSTEANYQNLIDLYPVMDTAMKAASEAIVAKGLPQGEFYGVTTKAIAPTTENEATNTTTILISTQRKETKGTNPARIFNQDIRITLIKEGSLWLVSKAEWLPEK